MSLADLFGGPQEVIGGPEPLLAASGPQEASCGDTEATVQEVAQTPSGIEVLFESKPKRLYKLRGKGPGDFVPAEWQEVPSVTTVLKVLDKPALPWWGMKVGVEGVCNLYGEAILTGPELDGGFYWWKNPEQVVKMLTEHKLTVNHVLSSAGDRGSSVHTAFETWSETGVLPDPTVYPETEAGYVQGLRSFLEDAKLQPLHTEVMVGSVQHGYAGRFDLLAYYGGQEVCTHLTPKGEKRGELCEPGLGLFDLKTSSGIYPDSHYRQLEAYETASVECGYEPSDFRAVIRVASDGRYEAKTSTASFDDFAAVLEVYKSNKRLKGAS